MLQELNAKNKLLLKNWHQQQIYMSIQHLQDTNKSLIDIANRLQKSSIMMVRQVPSIIKEIQHQLRIILTNLTTRINDYFLQMDQKIKHITQNFSEFSESHQQSSFSNERNLPSDLKMRELAYKVQKLEKSLKKTKKQQQKLIEVISSYINKYQIQDYPTYISQNPQLKIKLKNNMLQSKNTNSQPHLQTIHQSFHNQKPIQFIRKIYAKLPPSSQSNLKKSLKSTSTYYSRSKPHSNDQISEQSINHRLGYLMTKIKQSKNN